MKRLFATDLDGTLLNREHQIDETIRKGIEKAEKTGAIVAASTGRNLGMCRLSGLEGLPMILCNGAAACDKEGNILFEEPLDEDLVRLLYETFRDEGIEFQCADGLLSPESIEEKRISQRQKAESRGNLDSVFAGEGWLSLYTFNQGLEDVLRARPVKANLPNQHDEKAEKVEKFIEAHNERIVSKPSDKWIFEITMKHVNKAHGIRRFAEIYGIREDEIAVYGDGGNDIDMLSAFRHSYAPSTACEPARKAAAEIIGPYDEYSVIQHIEKTAEEQAEA